METIKIQSENFEGGFVIINKADFDEKTHKLFAEKPDAKIINLQSEITEAHTQESLSKKRKGELVAILEGFKVAAVPDNATNKQLIDEILKVQEGK